MTPSGSQLGGERAKLVRRRGLLQPEVSPRSERSSMATAFTLIEDGQSIDIQADVAGSMVRLDPKVVEQSLGWRLAPEGLCRGDVCVPVRDPSALQAQGGIDLASFAEALGRPLAIDAGESVAALGAAPADCSAQLASLEAPDFTLPDLEGKLHSLSDHRGKKVLLIAYASW
jgi:hypothetical protein